MKPLLLTGWCGPEFALIANSTLPLMERYADKHGMDFQCVNLHSEDAPPSWCKVTRLVTALRRGHETCLWLDADVVIFKSQQSILSDVPESSWQAMVEHTTECGQVPNCGVWVVTEQMLPTLEAIWAGRDKYLHHPWWEQAAMLEKMGYRLNLTHGWPSAERFEPTCLFDRTTFLPAIWNHHPSDRNAVEAASFVHVTQYQDRAAACQEFAKYAT